jgi:ABC-type transport system involved in multi-copper enzyme maturation permease subunit
LRSPETLTIRRVPFLPLLKKELREVLGGRALWTMLLLVCPLIGYSYFQAVSLYGEASAAGQQSPVLASSLSPLDGIIVPTFGAFYVAVTLLFPFVAIRVLGREKETGALRMLIQLPYRPSTLIIAKVAAIAAAWWLASIPALCSLVMWKASSGHLSGLETSSLLFGHLIYGLLIGAIALFAASISDSAATAAIITLAFTIGSWVLDFTVAGQPGLLEWLSRLSMTQVLRPFEQGLFSLGLVVGVVGVICAFAALAAIWLPPGVSVRIKLARSTGCVMATALLLFLASQITISFDVTEDRRNSFAIADERALTTLKEPLVVTVHLASEDPRYADLRRNVLSKLQRVMPNVTIHLVGGHQIFASGSTDENYGQIEFAYGSRADATRSTSPREILPLLYALAGREPSDPIAGADYPGYPLMINGQPALAWFFGGLPLLILIAWWWGRRPPQLSHVPVLKEVQP